VATSGTGIVSVPTAYAGAPILAQIEITGTASQGARVTFYGPLAAGVSDPTAKQADLVAFPDTTIVRAGSRPGEYTFKFTDVSWCRIGATIQIGAVGSVKLYGKIIKINNQLLDGGVANETLNEVTVYAGKSIAGAYIGSGGSAPAAGDDVFYLLPNAASMTGYFMDTNTRRVVDWPSFAQEGGLLVVRTGAADVTTKVHLIGE
jgi:hypothetical protein